MSPRPVAVTAAAALIAAALAAMPAALRAQPAAAPPPAAAPQAGAPAAAAAEEDPIVARVDGEAVRLSDVLAVAGDLIPPEFRAMGAARLAAMLPAEALRGLTERAVTERAMTIAAKRAGLETDPEVQRRMRRAADQELQQALLAREVGTLVTEDALRERFAREATGRGGEEEVQARHILVRTEAEARQVLAEVTRPGADFGAIARRRSTDPSGQQNGGDLGFFKKSDMVPEFAEAAFALQAGQTSLQPVRSPFGWHVIRVEARRAAPAVPYEQMRDTLRQQAMEEAVNTVVQRIRAGATVELVPGAPGSAAPAPAPAAGGTRSLLDSAAPPPPAQRR